MDSSLLEACIRTACEKAIVAEPKLTEWYMMMGDGDCGEALKGFCKSLITKLVEGVAAAGSVVSFRTLGAIFGILLTGFNNALKHEFTDSQVGKAVTAETYAKVLNTTVKSLKACTTAREEDRTVMDVLTPFTDEFVKTTSFTGAVMKAQEKAAATAYL